MYVVGAEGSDYRKPTSFIVNGGSASLLGSISNESRVQLVVVREKLHQEKLPGPVNESHWWRHGVVRGAANWTQHGLTLGCQHQLLVTIALWIRW